MIKPGGPGVAIAARERVRRAGQCRRAIPADMQHIGTLACRALTRPDRKCAIGGTVLPEEVLAGAESTAARVPTRRLHEVRKDDPVSSRVFRLARTAGHPSEIAGSTALPGAKPSWVTLS